MATHAYGTTLTWDSVSVAGLTSIGGFRIEVDLFDTTNHLSTSAYEEVVAGIIRTGEIPFSGWYDYTDTTGQHAMLTDLAARSAKTWLITYPSATGTTWTGSGYLKAWEMGEATIDGAIPISGSIKVTGVPTFAVSASTGLTPPFFAISESAVITPDPANDEYEYVANVLTDVTSVTVTPTATAGTITVNGNTVATGEASSAITLGAAGTNTTITIVVTETGKSPKTYTILVARAAGA